MDARRSQVRRVHICRRVHHIPARNLVGTLYPTEIQRHPLSQTVFVTEGVGLCQRRGGPVEVIRPGDTDG